MEEEANPKQTNKTTRKPRIKKQPPIVEPIIPIPPIQQKTRKKIWTWISTNSTSLDFLINALTFLVVACFGTWLVASQNNLLGSQNDLLINQNSLIQRQMQLEEANRRSALVMLMSNIMDKVDR